MDLYACRLSHTRQAVKAALSDDFNMPRALDATMELVGHGNRQLKALAQVVGGMHCVPGAVEFPVWSPVLVHWVGGVPCLTHFLSLRSQEAPGLQPCSVLLSPS